MTNKNNLPRHIAIIMDGNGRWAKERRLPRVFGHREGAKRVNEIVKAASDLGIEAVTFFAFSTENWNRPKREIDVLMGLLGGYLERQIKELDKENGRFKVIGRVEHIPSSLRKKIKDAEDATKGNTGICMVLAIDYGARQEIVEAAKKFAAAVLSGKSKIESLDTETFGEYLYTAGIPDPDLLIRTSGEMRISNFLLWQLSYAELYFPKKYWPDFKAKDLEEAIHEYQKRERRFGGIDAKKKSA